MARNVGICLFGILLLAVSFEVLSATYIWIKHNRFPYAIEVNENPLPIAGLRVVEATFHPYLGYVLRAGREGDYINQMRWRANNRGFQNIISEDGQACCDYPYVASKSEIIIGVFGGSVGSGFALSAQISNSFSELSNAELWAGRSIRVLNFALPGYKQPQQLMALAYFLNIGQKFDIIINIDGFNEAVTTFRNWKDGAEPNYPADSLWGAWGRHLESLDSSLNDMARIKMSYHAAMAMDAHRSSKLSQFASFKLMYKAAAGWHEWRGTNTSPKTLESKRSSYFPTAQLAPLPKDTNIWEYAVDRWALASISMADMARRTGAVYIHLLQPNQWDKSIGEYTPKDENHPYDWVIEPVNKVYPLYKKYLARLGDAGVHYIDSSKIFAKSKYRKNYIDDCCHYTQVGNERIFAKTISILKEYSNTANSPQPNQ